MKPRAMLRVAAPAAVLFLVSACDDGPSGGAGAPSSAAATASTRSSAAAVTAASSGAQPSAAGSGSAPNADLKAKCAPFDPPWGERYWVDWAQQDQARAETFLDNIEKTMKGADLSVLPQCTHLRNVFIGYSQLKDLSPLAKMTWLERLDLRYSPDVTDVGPLRSLQSLQYVNITGTGVKDLAPLADLPKLGELEARKLTVTDYAPVARMTSLRTIDLLQDPIEDLSPLAKAPMLEHVLVCTTKVKDISPLFPVAERITALDICGSPFRDFAALAKLKNLKKLRLTNMPIKDLKPLEGMTKLEELDLQRTTLDSLMPLHSCKALRKVDLIGAKVPVQEIEALFKAVPGVQIVVKAD